MNFPSQSPCVGARSPQSEPQNPRARRIVRRQTFGSDFFSRTRSIAAYHGTRQTASYGRIAAAGLFNPFKTALLFVGGPNHLEIESNMLIYVQCSTLNSKAIIAPYGTICRKK